MFKSTASCLLNPNVQAEVGTENLLQKLPTFLHNGSLKLCGVFLCTQIYLSDKCWNSEMGLEVLFKQASVFL